MDRCEKKKKEELSHREISKISEMFTVAENYFNSEQYPKTMEALRQWNTQIDTKMEQRRAEKLFIPIIRP